MPRRKKFNGTIERVPVERVVREISYLIPRRHDSCELAHVDELGFSRSVWKCGCYKCAPWLWCSKCVPAGLSVRAYKSPTGPEPKVPLCAGCQEIGDVRAGMRLLAHYMTEACPELFVKTIDAVAAPAPDFLELARRKEEYDRLASMYSGKSSLYGSKGLRYSANVPSNGLPALPTAAGTEKRRPQSKSAARPVNAAHAAKNTKSKGRKKKR